MEEIILIIGIVVILWILKKLFTPSDKIWKVAKKNGVKKTNSNDMNCNRCIHASKIVNTGEIYCSLKDDIEVKENMVCKKFEAFKKKTSNSLFGS